MEAEGILNAWTMKLVPNSARMTVTSSDSKYSENVVCSARPCGDGASAGTCISGSWVVVCSATVSSVRRRHLLQAFQRAARRSLFRLFLGVAFTAGHARAVHPDFYLKDLVMVGATF